MTCSKKLINQFASFAKVKVPTDFEEAKINGKKQTEVIILVGK